MANTAVHGGRRSSSFRANVLTLESVATLVGYVLLCRWLAPTQSWRATLLVVFGVVYFSRLVVMARWLLPRELAMDELTVVPLFLVAICTSFAVGSRGRGEVGALCATLSVALFVGGSCLNSGVELQRKRWKARPENRGRLYTQGLAALARNINYFGDSCLFAGWTVLSGAWWAAWVPLVMTAGFLFTHIPTKEKYLSERYKADWPAYAAHTPKFVPFLY